jgi:hypothetical protein
MHPSVILLTDPRTAPKMRHSVIGSHRLHARLSQLWTHGVKSKTRLLLTATVMLSAARKSLSLWPGHHQTWASALNRLNLPPAALQRAHFFATETEFKLSCFLDDCTGFAMPVFACMLLLLIFLF